MKTNSGPTRLTFLSVWLFPLLLIFAIFILPLSEPGIIVGGDWTFPYSNQDLNEFGQRAFSVWGRVEIPTGTQISHHNLYLFQILAKLWAGTGLDGVSFQKFTLFLTIFGIYFFSHRLFLKVTRSQFAATVGGLTYIFSPLVFNYLNMGWNFVLLFLALAPLFIQTSIDYFEKGKPRDIIALGLITSICFFQSQSIIWLPLIFICVFVSQLTRENLKSGVIKFLLASIAIGLIVTIVHLPWLLLIIINPSSVLNSTSTLDLKRFSEVLSVGNQFRLWGSLYNQQFEFAFPPALIAFSFFPIVLCLISPLFSSLSKKTPTFFLALSLLIIAPTMYIFRDSIAALPLSTVVRDTSRFLVISSIGMSLGVALSLSVIKSNLVRIIFCVALVFSAAPYFLGKLFVLTGNPTPQSDEYKDFRAKTLILPEKENESTLIPISDQTNLLSPVGGFLFTSTDSRFGRDFWGVADIQAAFSPAASGIYTSDKSDVLVSNFFNNYFVTSKNIDTLLYYFRVYGINNLVNRSGLMSTSKDQLDSRGIQKKCRPIDLDIDFDWSITSICPVEDPYPLIYSSVSPRFSTKPLSEIVSERNKNGPVVILGCPDSFGSANPACRIAAETEFGSTNPTISFKKINNTKYEVKIKNITGKFLLVFNNTYHPGWYILNKSGQRLDGQHLLVNQLVNGWIVDPAGEEEMDLLIEFYPQTVYSRLLPISLASLTLMATYVIYPKRKKKR